MASKRAKRIEFLAPCFFQLGGKGSFEWLRVKMAYVVFRFFRSLKTKPKIPKTKIIFEFYFKHDFYTKMLGLSRKKMKNSD